MIFFKGSHISGAILVYQLPCQSLRYEARELTFANLCTDGNGQRARHARCDGFRRPGEAGKRVIVCAEDWTLAAGSFHHWIIN